MSSAEPVPGLGAESDDHPLGELDDEGLDARMEQLRQTERQVMAAMAPFERQLTEVRGRMGQIATERRRRERAANTALRREVRAQAGSAEMPSLVEALAAEGVTADETRLANLAVYLRTGGECRLGFATKPGPTSFTDGKQSRQAQTWGEARALYALGWEPGTAQLPGVRIHLVGTRVERVVPADDLVVRPEAAQGE